MATVIFVLCMVLCKVISQPFIYSARKVIETYMFIGGLEGGIGLFWIVRIYLMVSLLAPVLMKLEDRLKNDWTFTAVCIGILCLNEQIYVCFWDRFSWLNFVLENFIMSALAYSVVYMLGIRLRKGNGIFKSILCESVPVLAFLLGAVYKLSGRYAVSLYKYPPRMVYILFGTVLSGSVWLLTDYFLDKNSNISKSVEWISKNSYYIYFAHALILKMLSWGDRLYRNSWLMHYWLFLFVFVTGSSCLMVFGLEYILRTVRFKADSHQNNNGGK